MRIVHAREGKCETDATFPRGGGATRNWHYRNPEAMIYFFRMWKCQETSKGNKVYYKINIWGSYHVMLIIMFFKFK